MLDRVKDKFDLHPEPLIADSAYGSGPMLGSLVERKIAPHIPVIGKAGRTDGTWTRAEFEWDAGSNGTPGMIISSAQRERRSSRSAAIIPTRSEGPPARASPNTEC